MQEKHWPALRDKFVYDADCMMDYVVSKHAKDLREVTGAEYKAPFEVRVQWNASWWGLGLGI